MQTMMTVANQIELAQVASAIVDEIYKSESKTAILLDTTGLASAAANGKQISFPVIETTGLGDHDRNGNYKTGRVTITQEIKDPDYDRSTILGVDKADTMEALSDRFTLVADTFIKNEVVPEQDAYTFAQLAAKAGGTASAVIANGDDLVTALGAAYDGMTEKEVPLENRILFITPTAYGLIRDMDTTKSRAILAGFSQVIQVPSGRFYTAIDLLDIINDTDMGGFAKASGALDINFMIVHRPAVIKFNKIEDITIGEPDVYNAMWKFSYRNYGITDVFDNKTAGVFVHTKPAA